MPFLNPMICPFYRGAGKGDKILIKLRGDSNERDS
jgi:hypothetical protein